MPSLIRDPCFLPLPDGSTTFPYAHEENSTSLIRYNDNFFTNAIIPVQIHAELMDFRSTYLRFPNLIISSPRFLHIFHFCTPHKEVSIVRIPIPPHVSIALISWLIEEI